jgi:hypothetical protein
MKTTIATNDMAKKLDEFTALFTEVMEGRDLCNEELAFYEAHPKEWHWRKFHLLMLTISELRKLHVSITEFALSHATIMPAKELNRILGSDFFLTPVLRTAVDCWEIDRNLAYDHFGHKFALSVPKVAFRGEKSASPSSVSHTSRAEGHQGG